MKKFIRKRLLFNVLTVTLFSLSILVSAQPSVDVKAQVEKLLTFVKDKDVMSFAKNTVYRGKNQKRLWKDVLNPTNETELDEARKLFYKLAAKLETCSAWKFGKFIQEEEHEGEWNVYEYSCLKSTIYLAFLRIKDQYALGDIDYTEDRNPLDDSVMFIGEDNLEDAMELEDAIEIDTTELLTNSAWIHKKRGEQIISNIRIYHFMKDGMFKVERRKGTPDEDVGIGMWQRSGKIIFTEFEGYSQHESEIIKISEDTLLLTHDVNVIDVFVKP